MTFSLLQRFIIIDYHFTYNMKVVLHFAFHIHTCVQLCITNNLLQMLSCDCMRSNVLNSLLNNVRPIAYKWMFTTNFFTL